MSDPDLHLVSIEMPQRSQFLYRITFEVSGVTRGSSRLRISVELNCGGRGRIHHPKISELESEGRMEARSLLRRLGKTMAQK